MEKGYKKQHFVPCLYLSEFVIQTKENLAIKNARKRCFYALFKNGESKKIPIDSQGQDTFHFSKKNREAKEKAIGETETGYKKVVNKFLSQTEGKQKLKKPEVIIIFTFLHQIHFGNPVYTISKKEERFEIWNTITADFIAKELLGIIAYSTLPKEDYFKQVLDKALEIFHFKILKREDTSDPFIISDNPAIIFSDSSKKGEVTMGLLPLTPDYLFVYCRKTAGEFIPNKVTKLDVSRINALQVSSCIDAVYSNTQFEDDDIEAFKKIKARESLKIGGFQTKYSYETRFFEANISTLGFIAIPNRTVILINGHPNSGKSTIREALGKKLMNEHFFAFDYDANFLESASIDGLNNSKDFLKAKKMTLEKIAKGASKMNIISDVLITTEKLLFFTTQLKNYCSNIILIRLYCKENIKKSRDRKRKKKNPDAPFGFTDSLNPKSSPFYDLEIDTSSKSPKSICNDIVDYIKNKNSQP